LDKTALAGLRRLAAAFTSSEEKPNATKVAMMFMVHNHVLTDSTALTGDAGRFPITQEAIAQSIDTLQSMTTFVSDMVQALDDFRNIKPPPGFGAEPE
jgi:hypothetical protein